MRQHCVAPARCPGTVPHQVQPVRGGTSTSWHTPCSSPSNMAQHGSTGRHEGRQQAPPLFSARRHTHPTPSSYCSRRLVPCPAPAARRLQPLPAALRRRPPQGPPPAAPPATQQPRGLACSPAAATPRLAARRAVPAAPDPTARQLLPALAPALPGDRAPTGGRGEASYGPQPQHAPRRAPGLARAAAACAQGRGRGGVRAGQRASRERETPWRPWRLSL